MTDKIILTIGMPTFNSSATIKDALDSILIQLTDKISDKIEVLISDNHSTDNSFLKIVNLYKSKYPELISYFKNDTPVTGLDGNLMNIFNNARGEYVWLLSDDDSMEDSSIQTVLDLIAKYGDVSVFMANYNVCDINMKIMKKRYRGDINADIYCSTGDEFFLKGEVLFGLISALIIKRDDWLKADIEKYLGPHSLHVGALIEILSENKAYIIADKLINLRTGNMRWGEKGTFIFPALHIVQMFNHMNRLGYDRHTYLYLKKHFYRNNLRTIASAKSQDLSDLRKVAGEMIKAYGEFPLLYFLHLPVLFIPNGFFVFLKSIRNKLR